MSIKLLPKSEIDKLKAEEKRREIEEGRKIAERIDTLRETVSEEEASLERFRVETVSKINDEIIAKTTERDTLEHLLVELREQRVQLLKPLDEEYEGVRIQRLQLTQWEESLTSREESVIEKEGLADEDSKEAQKRLQRAKAQEEIVNIRLSEANRAAKASEDAYVIAKEVKVATDREAKQRLLALTHREDAASLRENNATIVESDLSAREKALQDGNKLLRDREALHERTIKRTT